MVLAHDTSKTFSVWSLSRVAQNPVHLVKAVTGTVNLGLATSLDFVDIWSDTTFVSKRFAQNYKFIEIPMFLAVHMEGGTQVVDVGLVCL